MRATAVKKFRASVNGREFACEAGDSVEADKTTIAQLEAIGFVTTKPVKRGGKSGKAGRND